MLHKYFLIFVLTYNTFDSEPHFCAVHTRKKFLRENLTAGEKRLRTMSLRVFSRVRRVASTPIAALFQEIIFSKLAGK